jgi:DNA-binding transcriptional MerR regulator
MSEASRRLRVHPNTLRRWCDNDRLQPMRDSANRRLFDGQRINKLAAEREAQKAAQK